MYYRNITETRYRVAAESHLRVRQKEIKGMDFKSKTWNLDLYLFGKIIDRR